MSGSSHKLFALGGMLLAVACAVPTDDDLTVSRGCPQCGENGLSLAAAAAAPRELGPATLRAYDLVVENGIAAFCALGTATTTGCDLSPAWSAWSAGGVDRPELLRYLIKAALDAGFTVDDPLTGTTNVGMFGMANGTATGAWTAPDQELVSGSIALLTNGVSGVELCFATAGADRCPATYGYLELQAVGNLFSGEGRLVVGSPYAPDPQMNARTCAAGIRSCPAMEDNLGYRTVGCSYTGAPSHRRATTCRSTATHKTWTNPVTAFVLQDPGSYYLGPKPSPVVIF